MPSWSAPVRSKAHWRRGLQAYDPDESGRVVGPPRGRIVSAEHLPFEWLPYPLNKLKQTIASRGLPYLWTPPCRSDRRFDWVRKEAGLSLLPRQFTHTVNKWRGKMCGLMRGKDGAGDTWSVISGIKLQAGERIRDEKRRERVGGRLEWELKKEIWCAERDRKILWERRKLCERLCYVCFWD